MRLPILVLASVLFAAGSAWGGAAVVIRQPGGDPRVTITFSHDPGMEKTTLKSFKAGGSILQFRIECITNYVFYRPFVITQGDDSFRPVLCMVNKSPCDPGAPEKGYLYQGYLYLTEDFDLKKPLTITLADKVVEATFNP